LVTGGIGGIGTAICQELSRRGHRVAAGFFPPEADQATAWKKAQADAGMDMEIIPADVTSFEACAEMVRTVEERLGPVDILVNCAGITRDKTLRKMEPEQWKAVIATNLDSAFNVTKHVIDGMTQRGWGRVVNISSVNGQKGQFGQANYSAAKAGLHGFTMAVAQEVAAKGVTVNTVSPGYISTVMTEAVPEDVKAAIVAQVPVRRMGMPDEIAFAVAFLADERASYVTGANISVNGGLYMT
jgi:acetoacetyl-CoA reductase